MSARAPESRLWDLLRGALATGAPLSSAGFEPVHVEDGLIEARCR